MASKMTPEEGVQAIEKWLNQRLRIRISDQRSFEGLFKCVDRDCNIVLQCTEEFRDGFSRRTFLTVDHQRLVGLVVIPGKHIENVQLIRSAQFTGFI
jgi:small nuclear ribonucleoprotein (snRNP)-like protein